MRHLTENYDALEINLLEIDQKVIKYGFLPCMRGENEYNEDLLNSLEKKLEENEFIVSVCGQMNAGKSTFLNAWLFQDIVLPTNETPNTAKLILIRYGEKTEIKAFFYTRNEWQKLQAGKYYNEKITPNVEYSLEKGIKVEDVIQEERFIKTESSLKSIRNYVTQKGKFMPFVNYLEIYVPNTSIKNCAVVDTPGINDPDHVRSKITYDWITKSDAVIYLMHKKGLDSPDENFIRDFLPGVDSKKLLFVVNKIDEAESKEAIEEFVNISIKIGALRNRRLINEKTKVFVISSQSALIKRMENNNKDLTENLLFYKKNILNNHSDYFEADGFLPEVEDVIEKRLMNNKGTSVIEHHKQILQEICRTKVAMINNKIAEIVDGINYLNSDPEKRKQKMEELQSRKSELEIIKANHLDKSRNSGNDFSSEIQEILTKQGKEAFNDLDFECNKFHSKTYELEKEIPWIIRKIINDRFGLSNFKKPVDQQIQTLKDTLEESREEIERKVLKGVSHEIRNIWMPTINTKEVIDRAIKVIESLNTATIQAQRVKRLLVVSKDKTFPNLKGLAKKTLSDALQEIKDAVIGTMPEKFDGAVERMTSQCRKKINETQEQYEEIEKLVTKDGEQKKILEKEKEDENMKLNSFKKKKNEIDAMLGKIIISERDGNNDNT